MKSLYVVTIEALIDRRGVGEGAVQDLMMEVQLILATDSSSLVPFSGLYLIFPDSQSDFTSTKLL